MIKLVSHLYQTFLSDQSWSITTDEDIKAVWADPNIFVSLLFFIVFQVTNGQLQQDVVSRFDCHMLEF